MAATAEEPHLSTPVSAHQQRRGDGATNARRENGRMLMGAYVCAVPGEGDVRQPRTPFTSKLAWLGRRTGDFAHMHTLPARTHKTLQDVAISAIAAWHGE